MELVPLPLDRGAAADPALLAPVLTPRLPEPPVEPCYAYRLADREE